MQKKSIARKNKYKELVNLGLTSYLYQDHIETDTLFRVSADEVEQGIEHASHGSVAYNTVVYLKLRTL